jgi:hypothetical protein
MKDQLAKKGGDVQYGAISVGGFGYFLREIERPHEYGPGHGDGMDLVAGDPNRAQRWHHPYSALGSNGHHALGGEEKLPFPVQMFGDPVTALKIVGKRGELAPGPALRAKNRLLTLSRHFLS